MGGAGRKRIEVGTDAASPDSPTAILIVAGAPGGKKRVIRIISTEVAPRGGRNRSICAILGVLGQADRRRLRIACGPRIRRHVATPGLPATGAGVVASRFRREDERG